MKETWRPLGSSDPISYTCTCSSPGQVLLFYRYFSSPPQLPSQHHHIASDSSDLATFHRALTQSLGLKGKIRIAKEGFNVTVGGTKEAIEKYMQECMQHWSFSGLEAALDTNAKREVFFKPTTGCACVFTSDGKAGEEDGANVRVCEEITPMGVSNYIPHDWDTVESLEPAAFHERLSREKEENLVLVDVRNHYESRIGYFVNPSTGEPGIRPAIRRFGQWPQFVKTHLSLYPKASQTEQLPAHPSVPENTTKNVSTKERKPTQYMTYCTGGIRCEKGARFLAENLAPPSPSHNPSPNPLEIENRDKVCTLQGGIQAYLMWMDEEIKTGRKTPEQSLFRGRNYVFDARGSTGLEEENEKVASCQVCGKAEDRLSKCRSKGCHLILVVCERCDEECDPRCCQDCLALDTQPPPQTPEEKIFGNKSRKGKSRPICACEKERELRLWGLKPPISASISA